MDEFALIREVVRHLADRAQGPWVAVGPGDDAAVMRQTQGHDAVASIDTLIADVHFPASAPAFYIGYRALMVSLSDLAAMAAQPRYVLVALTLPTADVSWVGELAQGMAAAARDCDTYICGGNFARGQLSITVSVHGEVPTDKAVTRAGARVGDQLFVSGPLGLAAACVRQQNFQLRDQLSALQKAYFMPQARFDLLAVLRANAHAAIDISDGLLADAGHLAQASEVALNINSADLQLTEGVTLTDALKGGDDYQLLAIADKPLAGMVSIGQVIEGSGVSLDGVEQQPDGYNHFVA
ncbi:MAG: thiamine-phosphate kinase [Pseudomonadaceae bacterium]|nr:thiamine-phosphate kinase [Pseudomonadaceae bacterium]